MKAAQSISDFFTGFASFFKGMGVTFKNLVGREKITVQYPFERVEVSPRFRGLFYLPYDEEAKRLKCVGCTLCEQACPTNVISMTKLGAGKHAGVNEFNMDLGRCMFCNLCIEACPFDAIYMGPAYELASYNRTASMFRIADLSQGGAKAVEINNATIEAALAEEAARKAAAAAVSAEGEKGRAGEGETAHERTPPQPSTTNHQPSTSPEGEA
jgi:NADH-quinone oxidoreductase subunit I